MPIPDYQSLMLPLLSLLSDGRTWTMPELRTEIAKRLKLTNDELLQRLPSGKMTVFANRVAWAKIYLEKAGLLESLQRGHVTITQVGRETLSENLQSLDNVYLRRFEGFNEFTSRRSMPVTDAAEPAATCDVATPSESMQAAYGELRFAVADELLSRLKSCSPAYFEVVVVQLLRAMGYGGVSGEGEVTGRAGDGGIDGVIKEDKLGLDVVCIQAKRWENVVGRPVVQAFVGSMDLVRARKGVIMTTSTFSREAHDYVGRIEAKKVVLIDGATLTNLMIDHNVGVVTKQVYELKEVSNDFFDEDLA